VALLGGIALRRVGDRLGRVAGPDLLEEPRRDRRGHGAEDRDAGEHQAARDEAALDGHRVEVAVADGGDRREHPPQGVAERRDRGLGSVPLGLEHPERGDDAEQRHRDDQVAADAAAEVVAQDPPERRDGGDEAQQAQEPEERRGHDQQVQRVPDDEAQPAVRQDDPDHVVDDEQRPHAPQGDVEPPPRGLSGAGGEHLDGVDREVEHREPGQRVIGAALPGLQPRLAVVVHGHGQ
jgi:hypothetical protein